MILLAVAAILVSTAIVFGYLVAIWWLDRYDREPFWMVLLVFAWGAFGGFSLGLLVSLPFWYAATVLGGEVFGFAFSAVLVAPVVEEITKGLVFPLLLLTRRIDNETDGLIYGAATGLGFATVENLLYYGRAIAGEPLELLAMIFLRTLFTALMHCISSSLLGMCIGYAIHRTGALRWILCPAIGLVLAAGNHALWNGLVVATGFEILGAASPAFLLIGMLFIAAASALMFVLTQISLHHEHDVIRRHLLHESGMGTLPTAHAGIIPFWSLRRRDDWLPLHVPKDRYVRAATLLAFRLHQLETARGARVARCLAEIVSYRREVVELLGSGAAGLARPGLPPPPAGRARPGVPPPPSGRAGRGTPPPPAGSARRGPPPPPFGRPRW